MDKEVWKPIKDYEGLYEVSNLGKVKSLNRKITYKDGRTGNYKGKVLSPAFDNKGYLHIMLCKNNIQKSCLVHRLVAEAFIPNPDNKPQVNHKDENKINNCVSNLEYCDNKYNCNYGNHKITMMQKAIKKPVLQFDMNDNFIKEFYSVREAERETNIPRTNIINCCKGKYQQTHGFKWRYKMMKQEALDHKETLMIGG